MKTKTLIGRSAFSKLPALRISAPSVKHRHRKFKRIMEKGKSMADENQMDQGPAVSPQAEEKAGSGVTHPRERRKDYARPPAASAINIWPGREGGGMTAAPAGPGLRMPGGKH